MERRTNAA